jgi:hypothetical protein
MLRILTVGKFFNENDVLVMQQIYVEWIDGSCSWHNEEQITFSA